MKAFLKDLPLGFVTALIFSLFIYLADFGVKNQLLYSLLALTAYALVLYIPKKAVLWSGFFIGLLWFYWIGYSFKYQGVGSMTPFVTFGFGLLYMLLFAPMALTDKPIIRALLLFALSFVEPLAWNWFKPELLLVESYFGIEKFQFALILLALALPSLISHKKLRWLALVLLVGAIDYDHTPAPKAPLKIKLVNTHIAQQDKWDKGYLYPTLALIFKEIDLAKKAHYDVVVLPESVFPLFLNKAPKIIDALKKESHEIVIVAGALLLEDDKHYNVTYKFEDGRVTIAKKLVLVPFGEYIPLPDFAKEFINNTFFSGASDFVTAKKPTDFTIKGITFRNAICYEATTDAIYKKHPKYIIATSNNAWFTPSVEPTLQHLLLEYYARKYHVTIYHATNDAGTGIIN